MKKMQIAERNVPREDLECDDLKVVNYLMSLISIMRLINICLTNSM